MQIVTDRAADLTPEQLEGLDIHYAPLILTLDGKSYVSGVDIQPEEFYALLAASEGMPTTSMPSAGDMAEIYHQMAETDPEILSVHISSGLSGTINSARLGAELVPEAHITIVDTMTLSAAEGWQVEAASRAVKAGWSCEKIVRLLEEIRNSTNTIFTLPELKYLIHGGRIGHIKGLLASALNIKPLITVSKTDGKYAQCSQARTFSGALRRIVEVIARQHAPGTALRAQVMHAHNPAGAEVLREQLDQMFRCTWLPTGVIAPVLGAHTGPGLVGVIYAVLEGFPALP